MTSYAHESVFMIQDAWPATHTLRTQSAPTNRLYIATSRILPIHGCCQFLETTTDWLLQLPEYCKFLAISTPWIFPQLPGYCHFMDTATSWRRMRYENVVHEPTMCVYKLWAAWWRCDIISWRIQRACCTVTTDDAIYTMICVKLIPYIWRATLMNRCSWFKMHDPRRTR